jgi:hypothetical protein
MEGFLSRQAYYFAFYTKITEYKIKWSKVEARGKCTSLKTFHNRYEIVWAFYRVVVVTLDQCNCIKNDSEVDLTGLSD